MGAYIARQPNGLLCRFSLVFDAVTHYNFSEEEYIELCAERAREEARRNLQDPHFIKPFDRVVNDVCFVNITYEEWMKQASEMGYTEPDWKFKPDDCVVAHSNKDNTDGHEGEVWKSPKDKKQLAIGCPSDDCMVKRLLKEAVEGTVEEAAPCAWNIISDDLEGAFVVKHNLIDGDRVKLIVIKKE